MIIECINCNKIFEVNAELIPSSGRKIQCGSCDHIWFYKHGSTSITGQSKEKNVKRDNNLRKKIKPKLEEKILSKKIDKIINKKDTALTFMVIRSLPSKYDMYKDSLKQLYFADGLSEKLFNNWVGYGQRVEDRMGEKGFAKEVMHLIYI